MITSQVCRVGLREAKAQLKLNLHCDLKDNQKGFYKYIKCKKKTKDMVYGPGYGKA